MAKTKTKIINDPKNEQIVVENPPPEKKSKTPFHRDVQFLGEALVKETNRINELELSMESLKNLIYAVESSLKRVMNRMGL